MHGDGPAAAWAQKARPGDRLSFVGPKSSLVLPEEISSIVLVGDETALPAIGRFFDERPVRVPAHVLAFAADASAHQHLGEAAGDSVRWELMPRPDGELIAAAFERLAATHDLGENPFVWAAGEAASLLPLRRLIAGKVPRDHRSIIGYWHAEKEESAGAVAPALPEPPVAWFAVRTALQLGLLRALADRPMTAGRLSRELGLPGQRLDPLLGALASQGLVTREADDWAAAPAARDLLDDEHSQEEFVGPEAEQVLSLSRLDDALRTGSSAWELASGSSFADSLAEPAMAEHLEHESESLVYLQHSIVHALGDLRADEITVVGPGAPVLLEVAARGGYPGSLSIGTTGTGAVPGSGSGSGSGSGTEPADVAISALLLHHLDDDGAREHLRALAGLGRRALLLDAPAPDALSPAAALHGLVGFATTGVPARTWERMAELAEETGWHAHEARGLGWGLVAVELTPREPAGEREPHRE